LKIGKCFSLNLLGQFSPSGPLHLFLSYSPLCLPHTQPISSVHFWPTSRPGLPQQTAHRPSLPLPSSSPVTTWDEPKPRGKSLFPTNSSPNQNRFRSRSAWRYSPTCSQGLGLKKPIKSHPEDRQFHQNGPQTLASLPAIITPLHHLFRPNRSIVEHRRNSVAPLEHTPSQTSHQRGLSIDGEPRRRSPTIASPRRHWPFPRSKLNEFHTSLWFRRRRRRPKRTTVAQDGMYSGELGQPAMEHRRSAQWRRHPLPNLIFVVHHRIKGHD
jgi:hypothetical protein